jgi:hypothetical protein
MLILSEHKCFKEIPAHRNQVQHCAPFMCIQNKLRFTSYTLSLTTDSVLKPLQIELCLNKAGRANSSLGMEWGGKP